LPNFSFPPIPFDLLTFYDIAVSPNDPEVVWVTYSNFMADNKVFKTYDGGENWINITGDLPNFPVNCIVYQVGTDDGVYIGMDVGVFYIDNNLNNWFDVSNGLPNVVVTDLEIQYMDNKLVACTHGRGVWETELFNPITVVDAAKEKESFTFYPNPAYDKVTISFDPDISEEVNISLKDISGRTIKSDIISNQKEQRIIYFEIPEIESGIYLLELKAGSIVQSKKLIKL